MSVNYKDNDSRKYDYLGKNIKRNDFVYLKFNFTYMNQDCLSLDKTQSCQLTDTIFRLSNRPFLQISCERKNTGFESLPVSTFRKRKMTDPYENGREAFENSDRKLSDKRDIFRIREAGTARMIGKIYRNVYYVFYLDFEGKAYDHGN